MGNMTSRVTESSGNGAKNWLWVKRMQFEVGLEIV